MRAPPIHLCFCFAFCVLILGTRPVQANDVDNNSAHTFIVSTDVSNFDTAVALQYKKIFSNNAQLGLELFRGLARTAFIGGFELQDAQLTEMRALTLLPVRQQGPLSWHFLVNPGVRFLTDAKGEGIAQDSITVGGRLGILGSMKASKNTNLEVGLLVPVWMEIEPGVELAATGGLLDLGMSFHVCRQMSLFAHTNTGGLFGFGGDGVKFLFSGIVGVRWNFGDRKAKTPSSSVLRRKPC